MARITKPKSALRDTLAAVLAHPMRVRLYSAFNERTTSSMELVREWGIPEHQHRLVSHHVAYLAEIGIIEEVRSRSVRGGTERFYRATMRPIMYDEEFAKLTYEKRDLLTRYILQLFVTDATLSMEKKVFDQRTNRAIIRLPMVVDEQGFSDLRIEEERTYERRLTIATKSDARNVERLRRGEDPIEINIRSVTGFHEAANAGGALVDPPPEVLERITGEPMPERTATTKVPLALTLATVLKHPLRVKILVALSETVASANQLTRIWGLRDVGQVSHHIKCLKDLGLVEQVWERKIRNGRERFYRVIVGPTLYPADLADQTYEERNSLTGLILQLIVIDAALSAEEKIFDRRPTRCLIRLPVHVDEQGFKEMAREEKNTLQRRTEIGTESEDRMKALSDQGLEPQEIRVRSFTCFHEAANGGGAIALPPPPEIVDPGAGD